MHWSAYGSTCSEQLSGESRTWLRTYSWLSYDLLPAGVAIVRDDTINFTLVCLFDAAVGGLECFRRQGTAEGSCRATQWDTAKVPIPESIRSNLLEAAVL